MQRLAGEDSQFIFRESPSLHQHTMKVVVIDPAGALTPLTFRDFREGIREIVPHTAPFRRRLVEVPLGLGHPYWIDSPDLDIDYHVRRATVPSPGSRIEFAEVISMIASAGLERNRPLWQAWMVDGIEGGRLAYVMKVHHALADGLASAQLLLQMLQEQPEPMLPPGPVEDLPHENPPGRLSILATAQRDNLRQIAAVPRLGVTAGRWAAASLRQRLRGNHPLAKPFSVPKLRWNAPITPSRWFAYDTVSLPEMKEVKERFSTTVNDVFLATVAGGCRRYLERLGELPAVNLTATVPVATRTPAEARQWGNRVTTWMVELATTIDDPVERLRDIARRTQAVRSAREERGVDLQHDMMEAWPIFTLLTNRLPSASPAARTNATYSLIASNVPGPRVPLYASGARVVEVISMGPLVKDIGLNVTGWSYCDDFTIGIVACHEHLPDVWDLVHDTVAAFDELVALSRQ